MTWNALEEPSPRAVAKLHSAVDWHINGVCELPRPETVPIDLRALESRSTRRTFAEVSRDRLGALLWHVMRCKEARRSEFGFPIEHRSTPSAGALHPIHVVILEPRATHLALYIPTRHELCIFGGVDVASELRKHCARIVASVDATLLFFVAEFGRTEAKYDNASSLVWRDAGILQGVLAIAAEALCLNYCLLGTNGNPWLSSLAEEGQLYGVGAALLGSRP